MVQGESSSQDDKEAVPVEVPSTHDIDTLGGGEPSRESSDQVVLAVEEGEGEDKSGPVC